MLILAKKCWKIETTAFPYFIVSHKTRVFLKYFVNDFLWEHVFASNLPQTPLKRISFTIFVTLRHLTSFSSKFKQISRKKVLKFLLLANCISNLFTQAKNLNWKTFKFVLGHFLERYYFSISMTVFSNWNC